MNILILGGIFLLAFVAIAAAALLVMGERGAETNTGNSAMMKPAAMPAAVNGSGASTGAAGEAGSSAITIALPPQEMDAAPSVTPGSVPSAVTRTFPSLDGESFPLTEAQEERDSSSLNGQFAELSAELHALHTRSQEMEQRIGMLMEIIDRLEQEQGGLLDVGLDSEN